jgi:hypothetical protein
MKKTVIKTIKKVQLVEVEIPLVPNYIRVKGEKAVFSVRDFTEAELKKIGAEWTKALITKSKK